LLFFGTGCSEKTENGQGFELLPPGIIGGIPQQAELRQAIKVSTVSGEVAGKGEQTRVFVGRTDRYEMRGVLGFRVVFPLNAVITSAKLNLYLYGFKGDLPVGLSVYKLEHGFTEEEVTYEISAKGSPWLTPGGDFEPKALGEATFEGNQIDTVEINLDLETVKNFFATGDSTLPLIVIADRQGAILSLLAKEAYPTQPIASLLDVVFNVPGDTASYILERRSFQDATIVGFEGSLGTENLLVGDIPASQVFFSYDLGFLPPLAAVNRALLNLKITDKTIVDSFLVATYFSEELVYIGSGTLALGNPRNVTDQDSILQIDVTLPVQRQILERQSGIKTGYFVLASFVSLNYGGYVEFYPPEWPDSTKRPYLQLIYSDVPGTQKSTSQ